MSVGDACIIGVGTSDEFGFDLSTNPLVLQTQALEAALADAGAEKNVVDGLISSHGHPVGVDYDEFVLAAGLDIRWATQRWSHGRWAATSMAEAAMVVSAGLADVVAVVDTSTSPFNYARHTAPERVVGEGEAMRDSGGGHGEWAIHGIDTPGVATALAAQRYMDLFGATEEDLAAVAVSFRAHAVMNPLAIMRNKPMSLDDYFNEPRMAGPFRRADFCLRSDGSTCLLVTSRQRAADFGNEPVGIVGMTGLRASREDHVLFASPGLGVGLGARDGDIEPERAVYAAAGLDVDDVDGLYVYDAFSSNVWMTLDRFGFCKRGEAPQFIRDRGIGPGGSFPINTNGGLLSEAQLSGYAHLVEMCRQLRGVAGSRQIPNARVLQWATPRGDSVLLARR